MSTDSPDEVPDADRESHWRKPSLGEIRAARLPALGLLDRTLTKGLCSVALGRFKSIQGLEHVRAERDPFVLALNHATRFEALALPAVLMYYRGGRRVHFLADWNFQMIPGIGLLYRRSGAIVVMRKSARPRFLNVLKPLYAYPEPSHARARAHLEAGRSVGIYPEGTVNHDPERLLRGRLGAARQSLEAGVPVVPGCIRIVGGDVRRPLLDVTIGPPLRPPPGPAETVTRADIRNWHSMIMTEISRLSGKVWEPLPQEPRHEPA
jgi:1-acyl-sn-glycerol-3-phosphate acyltransferase